MKPAVIDQKEIYREVNAVTGTVHSVLFGTECLSELPVAELVQDFGLNISVCNRSVEEAVLADAFDLLEECVFGLQPAKVFLNFGDTDLRRENFDPETFLADYRRLIRAIQAGCACRVFLVPVLSNAEGAQALNHRMRDLAREMDAGFVEAEDVFRYESPRLRLFSHLMHYMREGRISFSDAMHLCDV